MPTSTKVLLVEDHGVVREGVATLIGNLTGFSLVGAVASGTAALTMITELRPDMLVLDLNLPDISGLEVLRRLRAAGKTFPTLVLTSSDSDHTVRQSLALGALGYFVKSAGSEMLADAMRAVSQGKSYLSAEANEQLSAHTDCELPSLREIAILRLASYGLSNHQIGHQLKISERTVKFHLKALFTKLDVKDRTTAVIVALRRGMLHL